MSSHRKAGVCAAVAVAFLLAPALPAWALNYDAARAAFEAGEFAKAEGLLADEIRQNPGHESAYALWGESLEKLGNFEASRNAWETLKKITVDEQLERVARRNMLRLDRRIRGDRPTERKNWKESDPFHVPGIEIDYTGLEEAQSSDYKGIYPPYSYETPNFIVYSCNEKLGEVVGDLCEKYLAFLSERLLAGRAWAFRLPILIYANHDDYVSVGGNPAWSGGVTYQDHSGRTARVAIPQAYAKETIEKLKAKNSVSYNLEDVLPHELTHMVINEFFGAQEIPMWLHEAFARQMEQNRDDYAEAAELARDAVAGEYFRFRDFFAAENYPTGGQIMRFYEQAATVVLFLLEHGPEPTRAFLTELAQQNGHDAAVAAAFGFTETEGAVERFEEMWVKWMVQRYVYDLERGDRKPPDKAAESGSPLFAGAFDELGAVKEITKWREVDPSAPGQFAGIGDSLGDWALEPKGVRAQMTEGRGQTLLAMRLYEELPIALKCRVKWTGDKAELGGLFGITVLDDQMEDSGIHALARLADHRTHELTCVIGDDLAVYLDDKCAGRSPVPLRSDDVVVDYPVALLAYAPVEVESIAVATIETFKSLTPGEEDEADRDRGRGRGKDTGKDKGRDRDAVGDKGQDPGGGKKPPPQKTPPKKKKPTKEKPKRPPGRVGP